MDFYLAAVILVEDITIGKCVVKYKALCSIDDGWHNGLDSGLLSAPCDHSNPFSCFLTIFLVAYP